MLILTRKVGEKLRISVNKNLRILDDIEIDVRSIKGRQVKIGINAPQQWDIYRDEIYEGIKKLKL